MKLRRFAADLWWALPLAMAMAVLLTIRWWHPYCDLQDDGPGYFATGLPLPYAMPTGASSMSFWIAPIPLVANVIFYLGCLLVIAHQIRATIQLLNRTIRLALKTGIAIVALLIGSTLLLDTSLSASMGMNPYDQMSELRPWFWAKTQHHRACYS